MSFLVDWMAKIADPAFPDGYRTPAAAAVVALLATLVLTPLVRQFAISKGAVDDPTRDERRVHTEPIPRWGGLAIFGGILISLLVILPLAFAKQPVPPYLWAVLACGTVLVIFGAMDDVKQYPARVQLVVLLGLGILVQVLFDKFGQVQIQGIAVPALRGGARWIEIPDIIGFPLTAIYIFVVTKTMDTIDGVDGLAGGIAAIAATTLALIATFSGQPRVALIAAAIAGACLGFLRYNWNPAKIFMGTGGAQVLGFLLASLSVVGAFKTAATLALLIPMLVFGVPIFDAGFVVVRRLLSGQPITQADKRHLHHTLLGQGFSQRQTVWILYLVAISLSGLMLFLVRRHG